VAVGGDHFTNDIAVGLRTPIPDAEKLKRRCGCALSAMVDEDETMEVASVGGRKPRVMARRILSEILQPRAEEIFHLLWDEIRRAGYEKSLNSGIVLTGGGAMLEGMAEIAEQIFDLPIRRGAPEGVGGLADHVAARPSPRPSACAMYAHRNRHGRAGAGRRRRVRPDGRTARGTLFKDFFCERVRCVPEEAGRGKERHDDDDHRRHAAAEARSGNAHRRPHQGRRRRRRRRQRRQPHGAPPASTASSSSSPTRTCRRSRNAAPVKLQIGVEADQGARRRRRPERRPPGRARGHRQAHRGARRRRHGVRDHGPRRRHGHRARRRSSPASPASSAR
jgi:cell division ATPase FtsA